jgi:hypothetical protein
MYTFVPRDGIQRVGFETGLGRLLGISLQCGQLLARRRNPSSLKIPCLNRASPVKVNLQDRVLRQTFRTPADSSLNKFPSIHALIPSQ